MVNIGRYQKFLATILATGSVSLLVTASVLAASNSTGGILNGSVNLEGNASGSSAEVGIDASLTGDVSTGKNSSSGNQSSLPSRQSGSLNGDGSLSASSQGSEGARNGDQKSIFVMTRAMLDGSIYGTSNDGKGGSDGMLYERPESVNDESALSIYTSNEMQSDARIEKVKASRNSVSVKYREDARVLGFIPGSIITRVRVNSDGDIKVRYPWYRFLVAVDSDKDAIRADLESRINTQVSGASSASWGVNQQARILSAIYASLRTSGSGDTSLDPGSIQVQKRASLEGSIEGDTGEGDVQNAR